MERFRRLSKGEKWLTALTLLFVLAMLGLYVRAAVQGVGGEYTVRVSDAGAQEEIEEPEPVNVNTATAEELMALPGVGEVLAQRIVEYREANGPFASPEELMNVKGIGESKLAAMRELIITKEAEE